MLYIIIWYRKERLYIENPNILVRKVYKQCKILVFLAFKIAFFLAFYYKYLERVLATLLALF